MKPVTQLPVRDAMIASAWGHTEASWLALTEQERAKARFDHTKAPRFQAAANDHTWRKR
jgi:hypothetical protein